MHKSDVMLHRTDILIISNFTRTKWMSFSSSATSLLHLPRGQRNRRGYLCESHLGGLSRHTCTGGRDALIKRKKNTTKKQTKSTNRSPPAPVTCRTPPASPSSRPSLQKQTDGAQRRSWRSRKRSLSPAPPGLHVLCTFPDMGGVGETGASHIIWNNLTCLYAKTPSLVRFVPPLCTAYYSNIVVISQFDSVWS